MKYLNFSKFYTLNCLIWTALISNFMFIFYVSWMYFKDIRVMNLVQNFLYHVGDITFYYFVCFLIYFVLMIAFAIELILRKFNKIQNYNELKLPIPVRKIVLWIGLLSIPISALGFYIFIVLVLTLAALTNML